jgi:hypothetical protein
VLWSNSSSRLNDLIQVARLPRRQGFDGDQH